MYRLSIALVFSCVLLAQVRHDYIVIPSGGTINAGSANRTAPVKVGTSLPGTCIVGDLFYKSDSTAGQNLHSCTSTNTWTQHTGAAGLGDPGSNGLVKRTSANTTAAAVAGTDYVVPAGNVATATALAANPANCSAGQVPLGVDASGAVEGCFTPTGSGDASTNTSTSVDSEAVLFSGDTGKSLKRSTLTGVIKQTSGVASVVTGTGSDCVKVDGTSGSCGAADSAQSANQVKAGPTSGGAATPSYRGLVSADIPATLDNKTLNNPTISTIQNTGTISLPTATDTLVGRATTDTLTNKTLTSPVINSPTGIVKGDVGLGNVDNTSDATKNAATATLTNKTLTAPVINSPTGIVKGDVGLGNVDNTSDATKNAATATLTNKTLTSPVINTPTGIVKGDVGLGNVDNTADASKSFAASQIGSGTFADARVAASNVTQHQAALALSASQTTSGVFAIGRLATGTPDGTKFVRDDGTLAVPPGASSPYTDDFSYTTTDITITAATHGKGLYPTVLYKDENGVTIHPYSEEVNGSGDVTFSFATATDGTVVIK